MTDGWDFDDVNNQMYIPPQAEYERYPFVYNRDNQIVWGKNHGTHSQLHEVVPRHDFYGMGALLNYDGNAEAHGVADYLSPELEKQALDEYAQGMHQQSPLLKTASDFDFDDLSESFGGEPEPLDTLRDFDPQTASDFYKFAVHPDKPMLFWKTKHWDSKPYHSDMISKHWFDPEQDSGPWDQAVDAAGHPQHAKGTIDVSPDGTFAQMESYNGRRIRRDQGEDTYRQVMAPVIDKFRQYHPELPVYEINDEGGMSKLAAAAEPEQWAYLNGHVGFGAHHHQILEQIAREAGLNDFETRLVSNHALINRVPADIPHQLAWGHMERGYPAFWRSNVDRNHVWDTVNKAHEKVNQSYSEAKHPEFNPPKVYPVDDPRWEDGTGIGAGTDGGIQSGDPAQPWLIHSAISDPRLGELVEKAMNEGGFSVNADLTDAPPSGYFTAYAGGQEIPAGQFGPGDIAQMQGQLQPGDLIGAWLDRGIMYLDRSRRFEDANQALQFGADQGQLSIYDANTGETIGVPGSGWQPAEPAEAPVSPSEPRAASVRVSTFMVYPGDQNAIQNMVKGREQVGQLQPRRSWSGYQGAHRFLSDGQHLMVEPEDVNQGTHGGGHGSMIDAWSPANGFPPTTGSTYGSVMRGWLVPTADQSGYGLAAHPMGAGADPARVEGARQLVEQHLGKPTHTANLGEMYSSRYAIQPGGGQIVDEPSERPATLDEFDFDNTALDQPAKPALTLRQRLEQQRAVAG